MTATVTKPTMSQVHKLRMRRLIKMLENFKTELPKTLVPDNGPLTKFDMNLWGCGTAACALGMAACHPYFTRQGLRTVSSGEHTIVYGNARERTIVYGNARFTEAAAEFFGIDKDEADEMFLPGGLDYDKVKPKHIAKIAREVLARYK